MAEPTIKTKAPPETIMVAVQAIKVGLAVHKVVVVAEPAIKA